MFLCPLGKYKRLFSILDMLANCQAGPGVSNKREVLLGGLRGCLMSTLPYMVAQLSQYGTWRFIPASLTIVRISYIISGTVQLHKARHPLALPQGGGCSINCARLLDVMWPVFWTVVRAYAPYVTFPVAFVVGAVGYHLEWFIRGTDPQPAEEEKSISERREDRKLDELLGKDHTQVVSLKDKLEFAPKAVLNRNRPEKN
ncbi:small integral membrane protein 12 isoform X1 [Talpa occidentalis]|uniref:small integral membrane protein 12 isoform X1 n=2 Tax=Talpa occidentalis TaxID=50954 RepID=UPI0023F7A4AA|nr:small integral membrane protein 12 isoform X1 [Talpa occidentalis]